MNPLDVLMVTILGYCLLMGFFRGLLREIFSIIGIFTGFFAGYMFYTSVTKYLVKWISDPSYLDIISFMLIFCSIILIFGVVGIIVQYLWKINLSAWVNRVSGAGMGVFKGILIVSVVMMVFTAFLKPGTPLIRDSLLAPRVALISEQVAMIASLDMKTKFKAKLADHRKAWVSRY